MNGRNVWALGLLSGNSVPVKGINSNLPFTGGGADVYAGIKAGTLFNYKTGGNAVILNRR